MDRTLHVSVSAGPEHQSRFLSSGPWACGGNEPPAQPPPATTVTANPAPVLSLHDAVFSAPESVPLRHEERRVPS